MPDRPNVLFLIDDEHRYDTLGYAGDDVVRTPTIDGLAEDGVVFENAYTPSPRCVPARQCLSVGQLPRTCGCERWGEGLSPGATTFARQLARHTYDTTAAGKLHYVGEDKFQGWTKRIGSFGGPGVGVADEAAAEAEQYQRDGLKWNQAKEVQRAGVRDSGPPSAATKDGYRVQGALNYIQNKYQDPYGDREDPDRPLLLKVSLSKPHYPYLTTEDRFNYYLNRVEPFSGEAPDLVADHPFLNRAFRYHRSEDRSQNEPRAVTPRDIRRATAAYYGMIEGVDEQFGRVLAGLEAAGEDLDQWVIVFTSDHGEMLGQYGLWEKGQFFEGSARVPLVVRYPERFDPGTVTENVNLCDLFATLCDLTNVPLPADHTLDSRSLVPLLDGDSRAWRERHGNETVSAQGDRCMVRRGDLKYVHHDEGSDFLFDLDGDADETTNRIGDPAYADAVDRLRDRVAELGYGADADPEYTDAGYDTGLA